MTLDNAPKTGYPRSTPLTPGQWTAVAVVGAVLFLASLALHVDVSPEGRLYFGITPAAIIGAALVLAALVMRRRAVARTKGSAAELPIPPRPDST